MAKMKIKDLVNKVILYEKESTLYKLGTFMNKKNGKYLLCDCSGLIKGTLWGYPHNGKYASNGMPDINANTMISRCSRVSTNFNKLPYGALVWLPGHVGIHIGNGVCIESSPIWENGIQRTFIVGSGYKNTLKLKERKWKKQGILDKYIDYSNPTPAPKPTASYYKRYTGNSGSIVTALKSIGVNSTYSYRCKIAKANGISNYRGTGSQNTKMLNLLKQGKLKKA